MSFFKEGKTGIGDLQLVHRIITLGRLTLCVFVCVCAAMCTSLEHEDLTSILSDKENSIVGRLNKFWCLKVHRVII